MSYAIPSASDLPSYETERTQTPSPLNPLGAKGIGESGAIGSTPAIWNAVVNAVSVLGVTNIDMPALPERVWQAIEDAKTSNGAAASPAPLHRFPGVLQDGHPGVRLQFQPARSVL